MRAIIWSHENFSGKRSRIKDRNWGSLMWQMREGTPEKKKKKEGTFRLVFMWRRWHANVAVLCVFCFGSANATAIAPPTLMVRRASVQHNKWISSSNSGIIVIIIIISSAVRQERRSAITAAADTAHSCLSQTGNELARIRIRWTVMWYDFRVSVTILFVVVLRYDVRDEYRVIEKVTKMSARDSSYRVNDDEKKREEKKPADLFL